MEGFIPERGCERVKHLTHTRKSLSSDHTEHFEARFNFSANLFRQNHVEQNLFQKADVMLTLIIISETATYYG
ncbi:unnamed protein product [Arctogadus glacialis]